MRVLTTISFKFNGDDVRACLQTKMKLPFSKLLLLTSAMLIFGGIISAGSVLQRTLKQLLWESKDLLKMCVSQNDSQWDCLKRESLNVVDNFANSERIPLLAGTSLVRVNDASDT